MKSVTVCSNRWMNWIQAVFFPGDRADDLLASAVPTSWDYLDQLAVVQRLIRPNRRGRVRYRGSSWYALCPANIILLPGRTVRVIGRANMTLWVEPLDSEFDDA
jgi:membrane-bound ClpP family serine protease